MLVNTVLTLPHVRYAVARAYVDYIFVIIFSAKIYDSYILSISVTYDLRISTCAEKERERFLENPSLIFECKFVRRTRTKEIGLVVFVWSSSDGNGARLLMSECKGTPIIFGEYKKCELLRVIAS